MTDTRVNPYAPPIRPDALANGAPRASGAGARTLGILLLSISALHVFRGALYLGGLAYAELSRNIPLTAALATTWAVTRVLTIFAVAAFAFWVHRANRDARSLGARGMVFTPGWTVATTFLPLVNLVAPFRAVREIYQASHPQLGARGEQWRASRVSPVLGLWWLLSLSSLAWFALSGLVLAPGGEAYRQPVLELLLATTGICFVVVVRRIDARLSARAARLAEGTDEGSCEARDASAA